MTVSWDQRIARAQKLSGKESPARELLTLYIKVTSFQKNVNDALKDDEHPDIRALLF